eukprot:gene23380-35820_t
MDQRQVLLASAAFLLWACPCAGWSIVGTAATTGNAIKIYKDRSSNTAYVLTSSSLQSIDVSDPRAPTVKGTVTLNQPQMMHLANNRAYVADGTSGVAIIDVTDPSAMTTLATVDTNGNASYDAVPIGNVLYVSQGQKMLAAFDISDLNSIALLAVTESTTKANIGYALFHDENMLYATGGDQDEGWVRYDVTNSPQSKIQKEGTPTGNFYDIKVVVSSAGTKWVATASTH